MGHFDGASDQSNRATHAGTTIPQLKERQAVQLRHRLAVIQSLALRARDLTIKTDMAKAATHRNDTVSSLRAANAPARD